MLAAAGALACGGARARADSGPPSENDVKAEMLCNIAKFIRWPDGSLRRTQGQIVFAILGEDELAGTLASTLSTRTVNGREIFVRFVRRPQDARGCQIVFIAASEAGRIPEVLEALTGTDALTVADSEGFVAHGGMVDFTRRDDRLHFEIDHGRAERAGLKISAKLLALAHVVDPAP